jgi:hypothetical protein
MGSACFKPTAPWIVLTLLDAVAGELVADEPAELRVEGGEHFVAALNLRHVQAADGERLGHHERAAEALTVGAGRAGQPPTPHGFARSPRGGASLAEEGP